MKINWDDTFKEPVDVNVMNVFLLKELLERVISKTGRALDIGCGKGDLAVKLARKGYTVEAVDGSAVGLSVTSERSERAGVLIQTHHSDLEDEWPIFENPFDLIVCKQVLAFISNKNMFLGKAASLLASEGELLLITPVLHSGYEYKDKMLIRGVNDKYLTKLLAQHFEKIELVYEDYFHELGHKKYYLLSNPKIV